MLNLPSKFKASLGNGRVTSLFPLVIIKKGTLLKSHIRLSIKSISMQEYGILGWGPIYGDYTGSYAPLLLSSPSIKSSADIINNKYTISSVSLSISNAIYQNEMFSDSLPSLLNEITEIYYCANGITSLDDCLLVYTGKIRRYSQSGETVNLTLEDLTEEKLTTKIPATLMDGPDFREEDIGKPYPMVYGKVDNSPTVYSLKNEILVDKPNQDVDGTYVGSLTSHWDLSTKNYYLKNGSSKLLQEDSFLSVDEGGLIPIFPKGFKWYGSRNQSDTFNEDTEVCTFNQANSNNSARITLNADSFVYSRWNLETDSGVGKEAIGTRIYRPIEDVFFRVWNHAAGSGGWSGTFDDRSFDLTHESYNTFVGYNIGPVDENLSHLFDFRDLFEHAGYTPAATSLYDNYFNPNFNNYDGGEPRLWQPTSINEDTTGADYIETEGVDEKWVEEGYEGRFPVNWLQNGDQYSGLNIHCDNLSGENTGGYVELILDKITADFDCVTKLFYNVIFTEAWYEEDSTLCNCMPVAFWAENKLAHRDIQGYVGDGVSTEDVYWDFNHDQHTWSREWDTENWNTTCNVPNNMHDFEPSWKQGNDGHDTYKADIYAVESYDYDAAILHANNKRNNLLQVFDKTNAYNSVKFGQPSFSRFPGSGTAVRNKTSANLVELYVIQDIFITDITNRKYYCNIAGRKTSSDGLLEQPSEILTHILEEELLYNGSVTEPSEDLHSDWQFAFSLNEQLESKAVFEGLFKSSLLIPSFDSAGDFKFVNLKQVMSASDIAGYPIINNQDILKYSFELSKLDDVCSSVNVRYKKNYTSGEFDKQTGYSIIDSGGTSYDSYQALTEAYYDNYDEIYDVESYYHTSPEDSKLEVETEYIREESTAIRLQKRLLMWHINQHLIVKLDLPTTYIHFEAGDYIKFDELIGGKLAFGYDYTQAERRNGQLIYPVFFITKISKSLTKVSIEAIQIHRGEYGFPADDDNDDGDIVNSEKVDMTDYWLLPDPYDNPLYNDQSVNKKPVEDPYINLSLDGTNLNSHDINAYVNSNMQEDWEYNLWIKRVNSPDGFVSYYDSLGELQTIQNGNYEEGEVSAKEFLNHSVTHSNLNDSDINTGIIHIGKKFILAPYGSLIEFIAKVNNRTEEDSKIFKQFGESDPQVNLGDVNQDGIVNILDVVQIVQAIQSDQEDTLPEQADINQDGIYNIQDIIMIINYIFTGNWDGSDDEEGQEDQELGGEDNDTEQEGEGAG